MSRLPWVIGIALLVQSAPLFAADQAAATLSLELGKIFTFFFLTLGPASVIGPFAHETADMQAASRRKVALTAVGIALSSVLVAATIGVHVLSSWGVSPGALLIAAGIMLFLVALESIRSQYSQPDDRTSSGSVQGSITRLAFRMAFPHIVSSYGIAIVILVLTTRPDSIPLTPIFTMLGAIMLLNAVAMLTAHRIARSVYIVPAFVVVSAVLSVLQAALGVQMVMTGFKLAGLG